MQAFPSIAFHSNSINSLHGFPWKCSDIINHCSLSSSSTYQCESNTERVMVKFSKQFEGQLVPEWKEAFVDYWQLKKDLKKVNHLNPQNAPTKKDKPSLSTTIFSQLRKFARWGHEHTDHGLIQAPISLFLMYNVWVLSNFLLFFSHCLLTLFSISSSS